MIKFAIKSGILGGAIYYTIQKGVWKDAETTEKIYNEAADIVCPYIISLKKQMPPELTKLPSNNPANICKYYWNKGVKATVNFTLNFPSPEMKEKIMSPFTTRS